MLFSMSEAIMSVADEVLPRVALCAPFVNGTPSGRTDTGSVGVGKPNTAALIGH